MFYAVPWSYGTLGFLVAAELDIIPAKQFVRLEYTPLRGRENIANQFSAASQSVERFDFVETLMYDRDGAVLMTGRLTDDSVADKVDL